MGIEPEQMPVLRLTEVLRKRAEIEGGYLGLARAIATANGYEVEGKSATGPFPVDRRKLANIMSEEVDVVCSIVFSIAELAALDTYLEPFGEGLAHRPLFEKPGFLQALGDQHEVVILFGAKLREKHVFVSHYDMESLARIQAGLGTAAPAARIRLQSCLHHQSLDDARKSLKQSWAELLSDDGPSLVVIASPRANHAAEAVLSQLFSTPAFVYPNGAERKMPFYFVWPPDEDSDLESCVAMSEEDIARLDHRIVRRISTGETRAFKMGGRVRLAKEPVGRRQERTYGVICAQRRPGGQIWLLFAGLTGPATLAAAQAVDDVRATIPRCEPGECSPVIWAPIEATVRRETASTAWGLRHVVSHRPLATGPFRWPEPK